VVPGHTVVVTSDEADAPRYRVTAAELSKTKGGKEVGGVVDGLAKLVIGEEGPAGVFEVNWKTQVVLVGETNEDDGTKGNVANGAAVSSLNVYVLD
jgi:hypothetical protein